MIAFLEVALRLPNAQILPLDSQNAVPAYLDHLTELQELYRGVHSSATFGMVVLYASQLVLRIFEYECVID